MQWLTPWTVIGAVLCVLALVVLFFPFIFKIDFEAGLKGFEARFSIFKKQFYKYEKKFSEDETADEKYSVGDFDSRPDNEEAVVPTYVPPKKKVEEPKIESRPPEPAKEKLEAPKVVETPVVDEATESAENVTEIAAEPTEAPAEVAAEFEKVEPLVEDVKTEEPKKVETSKKFEESVKVKTSEEPESSGKVDVSEKTEKTEKPENAIKLEKKEEPEKPEKRSLTDTEFWTILLTPEFDETAFWALKKWFFCLLRLFRIRFVDCFVEGFRGEVMHMGYGAALNGFLKGYPYIGDWDFRMDWTHDHELRSAGQVRASINLCRVIGLLIATLFYGGIIAYKFWRRRAHVLKTNELPELGWIRNKIVKMMAEE